MSRTPWFATAATIPIAWLGLTGCKDKPSGPATYAYTLSSGRGLELGGRAVTVDGVGYTTDPSGRLELPRAVRLSDPRTKLAVTMETSCGELPIPFAASGLTRTDEDAARAIPKPALVSLEATDDRVKLARLYLDNSQLGTAAAIRVGKATFEVKPASTLATKVVFGPCEDGRQVRVEDRALGVVPSMPASHAALISTTKEACYLSATLSTRPGIQPDPSVFRVTKHITPIREVDYPFRDPQELVGTKVFEHGPAGENRTVLTAVTCVAAEAFMRRR